MDAALDFRLVQPDQTIAGFVESFWMLSNRSDRGKDIVVLPDGRIDLICSQAAGMPFHITLSGLETHAEPAVLPAGTVMFAVSFKLLAVEYLFHNSISGLLNYAEHLPLNFWDFEAGDLQDFDLFCAKASRKICSLLPDRIDSRKAALFELIYASKGAVSVKELSEKVFWSSRQINRYFNQQFGLSLKTYAGILRFRASLEHMAQGKLVPNLDFTDQSHFIKEVRKFSGVSPKEIRRNQNGRFIQFSTLAPE